MKVFALHFSSENDDSENIKHYDELQTQQSKQNLVNFI